MASKAVKLICPLPILYSCIFSSDIPNARMLLYSASAQDLSPLSPSIAVVIYKSLIDPAGLLKSARTLPLKSGFIIPQDDNIIGILIL